MDPTRGPAAHPRYSASEAAALLPEIRAVLLQLAVDRQRLHDGISSAADIGDGMRALVDHLETKGVELRDLDRGLVDIAGERDGASIWWCWTLAEPEIGFWHTTREGFAQRKPL
jgi:hypothetical protein